MYPGSQVHLIGNTLSVVPSPDLLSPPLVTQTAQSKFAEIAEAYEVLSDESSRQLYDHARRLREAHHHASNGDPNRQPGRGGDGDWEMGPAWYYSDGMGWDNDFGSSFSGGAAGGGGFGAAFGGGGGPFGGGGGGGRAFEFRVRDPLELFEVSFLGCCVPAVALVRVALSCLLFVICCVFRADLIMLVSRNTR